LDQSTEKVIQVGKFDLLWKKQI